jgi:hypothetical protein
MTSSSGICSTLVGDVKSIRHIADGVAVLHATNGLILVEDALVAQSPWNPTTRSRSIPSARPAAARPPA